MGPRDDVYLKLLSEWTDPLIVRFAKPSVRFFIVLKILRCVVLSDDSASELVVTVYCTNRAMLEKGHLRINGRSHKVSREFEDIAIRPYHSDRDNP